MSFDLHLNHFSNGESAPVDPRPVLSVLKETRHTGPSEFGFYRVAFPDQIEVEFSASDLDGSESFSGCAFHIRGISASLINFVFEVAKAGNFVIFNCQVEDSPESPVAILIHADQMQHLPEGMGYSSIPVCTKPEMLAELLFPGHEAWQEYRDRVVGAV